MGRDFLDRENRPIKHDDEASRRREERIKKRWLWMMGIVGFLLPGVCPPFTLFWTSQDGMSPQIGMSLVNMILASRWPYAHLFTPGMPLDSWFKAVSVYTILAVGATVSAVWFWHRFAHTLSNPNWKQGIKAGSLASLLAYPLTGILVIWFNQLAHPIFPSGIEPLVSFLLAIVTGSLLGSIGLLMYGWWTTPIALALGALCGLLEMWVLRRRRGEQLKY
jgi:hypothetical protein